MTGEQLNRAAGELEILNKGPQINGKNSKIEVKIGKYLKMIH